MSSLAVRLRDILDAIEGIRGSVDGLSFADYVQHWTTRRVTERGIEIISEASRHIPNDLKARFPGVPWPAIQSIGNRLRHEYGRVDDEIVWNIAVEQLERLEPAIRALLDATRHGP